jgi:hypothetical protein
MMLWLFLFIILITAVVAVKKPSQFARIISAIVSFLTRKSLKKFQLGYLALLPLDLRGFEISKEATQKSPGFNISFKQLTITINWQHIVEYFSNILSFEQKLQSSDIASPFVSIVFHDFAISSNDANLLELLMPSESAKPQSQQNINPAETTKKIITRIICAFLKRLSIDFKDFSVDLKMPANDCSMSNTTTSLSIYFQSSKALPLESLTMVMIGREYICELYEQNERALLYAGHLARGYADYHLPSGIIDLIGNLYGTEHEVEVSLPRILAFLETYQHVEDFVCEIKKGRGLELSKMSMSMSVESIKVGLIDPRVPGQLIVQLEKMRAFLVTYKLTVHKENTHKGKLLRDLQYQWKEDCCLPNLLISAPFLPSSNQKKHMRCEVDKVRFQMSALSQQFFVEKAVFDKSITINNDSPPLVDDDDSTITFRNAQFFGLDDCLVDWLIVLQDFANRIPFSSLSHVRDVKQTIKGSSMSVSLSPPSHEYDMKYVREQHSEGNILPPALMDDERLVALVFQYLDINKLCSPGSSTSQYTMKSQRMEVRSCLALNDFAKQHGLLWLEQFMSTINANSDNETTKNINKPFGEHSALFSSSDCLTWSKLGTGSVWKFASFEVSFLMNEHSLEFQKMSSGVYSIDFTDSVHATDQQDIREKGSEKSQETADRHEKRYSCEFLQVPGFVANWKFIECQTTSSTDPDLDPAPAVSSTENQKRVQQCAVEFSSMKLNVSTLAMIKIMANYDMIKAMADWGGIRMSATKRVGDLL